MNEVGMLLNDVIKDLDSAGQKIDDFLPSSLSYLHDEISYEFTMLYVILMNIQDALERSKNLRENCNLISDDED